MKKKLLSCALPVGLILAGIYFIGRHFSVEYPNIIAYPMLLLSVVLLIIGIVWKQ